MLGRRPQARPDNDEAGHDQDPEERRTWALAREGHGVRPGLRGDGLALHGRSPIGGRVIDVPGFYPANVPGSGTCGIMLGAGRLSSPFGGEHAAPP